MLLHVIKDSLSCLLFAERTIHFMKRSVCEQYEKDIAINSIVLSLSGLIFHVKELESSELKALVEEELLQKPAPGESIAPI